MMIEDIKQFYKYYKLYKKGKTKMEEIKKFVSDHKKEIIFVGSGLIIYHIGFNRGFKTAKNAISHVFDEAARTLPIVGR